MNCKQVEELLPLYAGRDLEEKRATFVTEHLQTCVACARVADEYRESIQLSEQFAPPVFSEGVYAGIRQRVLREIETAAPSQSHTMANLFRPRLTWARAGLLLIVVSVFAVYFTKDRRHDEQQLARQPLVEQQPETKERADSGRQGDQGANHPAPATIIHSQRKGSREMNTVSAKSTGPLSTAQNVAPQPGSLLEPAVFPHDEAAASAQPLRVEIQTKDPRIRIIWFVQREIKPSKGT